MNPDDELLARLRSHDVAPAVSERIVRQAYLILRERGRRGQRAAFWLSTYYYRIVEPAAIIALGLGYVAWTVRDTVALFHP
jgi:hypothetical protein